jgi:hypothetical protein
MKILLKESQLNRLRLLSESDMSLYFTMANKRLDEYIKYLNNLYVSFADISVLDVLNMEYETFKTHERSFDAKVDEMYNFISEYERKTEDFPEEDKYRTEMNIIYKKELIYREKENMITKIFYSMSDISNIKDEFDKHPFDDTKPINIG